MAPQELVVVGGGIAGIAVAWQLAKRGHSVTLLERERQLCTHSSARNAAIWLPFDADDTTAALAVRSAEIFDGLLGSRAAWLDLRGALMVSRNSDDLDAAARGLRAAGGVAERVDGARARSLSPVLCEDDDLGVLWARDAGVLDIHAMTEALASAARREGCRLQLGRGVRRLRHEDGAIRAVEFEDGECLACDQVVVAAGAWVERLAHASGLPLTMTPLRRHLIQLDASPRDAGMTVWSMDDEVYFRPESDGVLASPCDEQVFEPCLPPADDGALELLAGKFDGLAPGFGDAHVRRSWACLRTFAPDRELALGPDPRVRGLAWFAGLGGRGMTVAAAAAEWCAGLVCGDVIPAADPTRVDRLIARSRTTGDCVAPPT